MASSSSSSQREEEEQTLKSPSTGGAIIPGLPDDLTATCILPLLPISLLPALSSTSSSWHRHIHRHRHRHRQHLLCIFPTDPHLLPRPHLLDPSTLLWLPLPPLPPDPHCHSLSHFLPVSLPSSILLLGGSRFDARSFPLHLPSPSPSASVLPLQLPVPPSSWSPLPPMPTPRGSFACAATCDGRRVLTAGGGSRHAVFPCGGTRTAAVECLDLDANSWVALPPMQRERAGCVGWVEEMEGGGEEEFWVVGGYAGYRTVSGMFPEDVHCRDGEVLGLRSGRWRTLGDMWEEGERRKLGKVAVVERRGERSDVFMLDNNSIFRYDVASNRWFKETTLRKKLPSDESCGFVAMNGELYVMTSYCPTHSPDPRKSPKKKAALDMQIYDPRKRKWRFLTTSTPFKQPLDFRIAVLCTVRS